MRVPSGGPATINGILYQMLWSLLEATTIRLQNVSARTDTTGEIVKATLVLEPSRGGDASLIRRNVTRIVQLKARSDGSTWSLRELIFDVLPDLYRAVDLDQQQEFVFVTEGRPGDWSEVATFFASLADLPFPNPGQSVIDLLDGTETIHYRGAPLSIRKKSAGKSVEEGEDTSEAPGQQNTKVTEVSTRDLFVRIVNILRAEHKDIGADAEGDTQRKVWRLLSRLEFRWSVIQEQIRTSLLTRLRTFVDNPDATEFIFRSLLTALQERATGGDAQIEADHFFAEHGLRGIPLARRQWPQVIQLGAEQLQSTLRRRWQYVPEVDVRPGGTALLAAPEIDLWRRGGAASLVLSGGSGQGKSWRLYALALALSKEAPVVIVSASDGPREAVKQAAREFWGGVCHRSGQKELDEIARFLAENDAVPVGSPWLYILVDGVQTQQDAIRLSQDLAGVNGVRLAFTASERTAENFGQAPGTPTSVGIKVGDFSESELRQYIAGGDAARYHAIRDPAVRRVISRPLLALIYKRLPGASEWDVTNEYRLYNAYFSDYILRQLSEADSFTAKLAFNRAGLALWNGERYPWSAEQMNAFRFDGGLIAVLQRMGFLQWDSQQDGYAIWHDRLKEWLAAYALSKALINGEIDLDEVARRFRAFLFPDQWHPLSEVELRQQMRYVPMDVIWHLAQRLETTTAVASVLDALLHRLEGEPIYYRSGEALYEGYISTIGSEVAPAVFRRLISITDQEEQDDFTTRTSMTKCLAGFDARIVSPIAIRYLSHTNERIRHSALAILAARPIPGGLPILWDRLVALKGDLAAARTATSDPSEFEDATMHGTLKRDIPWELDRVRHALAASVPLSPEWLLREIQQLPKPTGVNSESRFVADLIALLHHTNDHGQCWREVKERIRSWTETGDTDSDWNCQQEFATCVYHWRDVEETEWLRDMVGQATGRLTEDFLHALIRVAPDVALTSLRHLPPGKVRFTGDWGLHYLLAQRPGGTRQRMAELIESEDTRRAYADVFSGSPDAFPVEVLDSLVNFGFSALDETSEDENLWWLIDHLDGLVDLPHLRHLWQLAGTDREERLACLYEAVAARNARDHRLEELAQLLSKIGGNTFARVVNMQLSTDDYYVRMAGIRHAHLHPNEETIRLLESLALDARAARIRDEATSNDGKESPYKADENYAYGAQEALALCRAFKALVRAVVVRQHHSPRRALSAWVGSPLPDDDMRPALDALQSDPTHPGAILALGLGRRVDFAAHIASVLSEQDARADNQITNACHYALVAMPELPPDAVTALGRRLPFTRSGWLLWHALKRNGSPTALQVLLGYLRVGLEKSGTQGPYSPYDFSDVAEVARYLLVQPSVRDEAIALCRDTFIRESDVSGPVGEIISSLAPYARRDEGVRHALDCPQARDYLFKTAFAPQRRKEIRSILGLAAFAPDDAYAAAINLLHNEQDNVHAPVLLLDIDSTRAIPELFAVLTSNRTSLKMRHHIAYALSSEVWNDGHGMIVRDLAFKCSVSSDPCQRHGAAFVFGFLPPASDISDAIRAMMDDEDVRVYETACASWNHLETTRSVGQLVDAFLVETDSARRWILLNAALQLGDPGDEYRAGVPEWLGRMAARLSPLEWEHVAEKLTKRREEHANSLRREGEWENGIWL